MGNLPTSFPVSCINSLKKCLETEKGVQLVMVDHIVFDMFGDSIVSLSAECCFAPLNVCGYLLEFDEVLCSLIILLHVKSSKFSFCFTDWIVSSEDGFNFLDKQAEIQKPSRF